MTQRFASYCNTSIIGLGLLPIKNMKGDYSKPLLLVTLTFWLSIILMYLGALVQFCKRVEHTSVALIIPDEMGSLCYYGFGFLQLTFLVLSGKKLGKYLENWQRFEEKHPCYVDHLLLDCMLTSILFIISAVGDYLLHFVWHFESSDTVHGQVYDWEQFLLKKCETKTLAPKCNIYYGIFTLAVDLIIWLVLNVSCILVSMNATALYKRYMFVLQAGAF